MKSYNIKDFLKNIGGESIPDDIQEIAQNTSNSFTEKLKQQKQPGQYIFLDFFTKNNIFRLAAAAVVITACITGLTMFKKTSNINLVEVLKRIEKVEAYKYPIYMNSTGRIAGNRSTNTEMDGTILMSQDYGLKMTMETLNLDNENTMLQETYLLPQEHTLISIMHTQKSYTRMEVEDAYIEKMKAEYYEPFVTIQNILQCQYYSLGRSTINGVKVEGFQTTDPKYYGGVFDNVDIKLWIDIKTQLPVQMVMNLQMKEQVNMGMYGIIYDFQWDVPVYATDFQPVILEDYTNIDTYTQVSKAMGDMKNGY